MEHAVDRVQGGFHGALTNELQVRDDIPRALVLCARILWTYSRAWRVLGVAAYGEMARRAFRYLADRFRDPVHGGFFWQLDRHGAPLDERKLVYGHAFAIYGLAEFWRASADPQALRLALEAYRGIESCSGARGLPEYHVAHRDWTRHALQRLHPAEHDAPRQANVVLHLLEACANLLRAGDEPALRQRHRQLLDFFLDDVVGPAGRHCALYFDADWRPVTGAISHGHDIETSWLLTESAAMHRDPALAERAARAALALATSVLEEALEADGGLVQASSAAGVTDATRQWWAQAEAVVGFCNAYQLSGQDRFLDAALRCWDYIEKHFVDRRNGEWFAQLNRDGTLFRNAQNLERFKAGPWKCPYHNARACLEIMDRIAPAAPPAGNRGTIR